jgi:hypothetical protein
MTKKQHIAKMIFHLQNRGKSKCKRCYGEHGIWMNIPTKRSRWCKGVIDLGVGYIVPCPSCHPNYFKRYITELVKERSDLSP